ncbi:hypothetical protein [Bacillus sp. 03113]|uniref:hypothetical protein n=1 Tax=Bacillus sp. 03113 TaxID=2578211 RepID=UPI0015E88997|nr:hypothetical protein [Bacillus sp. 03113]
MIQPNLDFYKISQSLNDTIKALENENLSEEAKLKLEKAQIELQQALSFSFSHMSEY